MVGLVVGENGKERERSGKRGRISAKAFGGKREREKEGRPQINDKWEMGPVNPTRRVEQKSPDDDTKQTPRTGFSLSLCLFFYLSLVGFREKSSVSLFSKG